VTLYGANLLVASLMLSGLLAYVARNGQLVIDGLADDRIRRVYHQRKVYLVLSAAAILVGIVAPLVAVGFYVVLTVAFIVQPLVKVHRSR
jgi:hypothetical protein